MTLPTRKIQKDVQIPSGTSMLEGEVGIPAKAKAVVVFAHGSGSSRLSPRNQFVAETLRKAGLATLLFDLLTSEEDPSEVGSAERRFDIDLLSTRLIDATRWLALTDSMKGMRIGYFGASTGAAAALRAAAELDTKISAVVSRGGRPDLAGPALARVTAPTLLLVGALDEAVIAYNEDAFKQLRCDKHMQLIPGATHLFEEFGTLEEVAHLATEWFVKHLLRSRDS
jgi:dienelactone hydrolase